MPRTRDGERRDASWAGQVQGGPSRRPDTQCEAGVRRLCPHRGREGARRQGRSGDRAQGLAEQVMLRADAVDQ